MFSLNLFARPLESRSPNLPMNGPESAALSTRSSFADFSQEFGSSGVASLRKSISADIAHIDGILSAQMSYETHVAAVVTNEVSQMLYRLSSPLPESVNLDSEGALARIVTETIVSNLSKQRYPEAAAIRMASLSGLEDRKLIYGMNSLITELEKNSTLRQMFESFSMNHSRLSPGDSEMPNYVKEDKLLRAIVRAVLKRNPDDYRLLGYEEVASCQ